MPPPVDPEQPSIETAHVVQNFSCNETRDCFDMAFSYKADGIRKKKIMASAKAAAAPGRQLLSARATKQNTVVLARQARAGREPELRKSLPVAARSSCPGQDA